MVPVHISGIRPVL